jgi:hypothetical protein
MSSKSPGGALYRQGEASGDLSRSGEIRATATAAVRLAGVAACGEATEEGRGIQCEEMARGRKKTSGAALQPHGQNSAR